MCESKKRSASSVSESLCALYAAYGYMQYNMSKFEAYDLYVRNKDFLISDSVITFTDTNGQLMALKPDVTLSIVKNNRDEAGVVQRLYYQENVYRISKGSHCFRELPQTGLECMGDLDAYCLFDVIRLACLSLREISENSVLDLSHLTPVKFVFDRLQLPKTVQNAMLKCIGEKNLHELRRLCSQYEVDETAAVQLETLVSCSGDARSVLPRLQQVFTDPACEEAFAQLQELLAALQAEGLSDMVHLDFSVVSDMKYYSGFVFKGFVEHVPNSVLSGGQYDPLMRRMGRSSGAIGFAVYFDELARLFDDTEPYDLDTLLLYDDSTAWQTVEQTMQVLRKTCASVSAQRKQPAALRCRRVLKLENGEVTTVYEDA